MVLHVVYDGRCGFCSGTIALLRALDARQVLRMHDASRRAAVESMFPQLREADLDAAVHVVEEGGAVYRGFFAARRLAWSSPFTWPLLPVLYLPGAARVGPRVYEWIAGHRGAGG
jgi:predicted DCC family thiol-disulfide oxidoreductase YuxK